MIKSFGAAAVSILALATVAMAAPATPEEAQRLTTLFERYVGHPAGDKGAVSVAPHGEAYTATLDVSRLFGFLSAAGYAITAAPLVAELTPQNDGRWHVTIDGLPIVGFAKADQAFSLSIKGYTIDGMFDPKIQAFASAATATAGSVSHGNGPKGTMNVTLAETGTGTYGATDAGGGTIDTKASQTIKDFTYSVDSTMPGPATVDAPNKVAFAAHGAELDSGVALSGVRVIALNDLWAFLVAHPSKEALVAAQPDLKTKLRALLPLAGAAVGDLKLSDLSVTTDMGTFGLGAFAEHYEFGSPAAKDSVATGLTMSGPRLPAGLVPVWAAPLVPTSVDIRQTYGPLNLTPALQLAIDGFDLAADKPLTDAQEAIIKQTLAEKEVVVAVAPSVIATPSLTVKFEGDVHMTQPMPTGTATVAVTGLDKTIDLIRAAAPDDPNAAQAIGFLSAVKVLAKAEGADSYSWHVVAAPGAEITVNGNPLSAPAAGAGAAPKPKGSKKPKSDGGTSGHVTIPPR